MIRLTLAEAEELALSIMRHNGFSDCLLYTSDAADE